MTSPAPKYGIAEWYGNSYLAISNAQRLAFSKAASTGLKVPACPFREGSVPCNKAGGVCSIRKYSLTEGMAVATSSEPASICITCPNRFRQAQMIYRWIGEELLGDAQVAVLGEIGFLERVALETPPEGKAPEEVGRIDNILVKRGSKPLQWCAVETQAVYFSGIGMDVEFEAILEARGSPLFPRAQRRPDFRSSGPKRLMPQLQIKVPTLRRWGRKMAVVVDSAFFESLGPMRSEQEKSSADIAWFIVSCAVGAPIGTLEKRGVVYTTLENAVEGLTAGKAMSQDAFERKIVEQLIRLGLL